LIESWDQEHSIEQDFDPVEMLVYLMNMQDLNASQLSKETKINKTVISKILN
jgi:antitoxin component HigA of HigAB toxin-antitoxin module